MNAAITIRLWDPADVELYGIEKARLEVHVVTEDVGRTSFHELLLTPETRDECYGYVAELIREVLVPDVVA